MDCLTFSVLKLIKMLCLQHLALMMVVGTEEADTAGMAGMTETDAMIAPQ